MNSSKSTNKIAIIGLGYVGLPLALLAKEKGHDIIGVDINNKTVKLINKGISPIQDDELEGWIKKVRITATTNLDDTKECDIFIICVPTPVINHTVPDLGPVKSAAESIANVMKKGTLIILESTVNPGVSEEVIMPLIESKGFRKDDYQIAHCPERINPGDPNWNVRNINRVVGSNNAKGLERSLNFYKSIIEASIKPMNNLKEAEAVKIVENSFRDVNIAFVNELAMSFDKMGINVENVINGASTKPFAFMPHRPGCGVGGHCIPVDPYYLIEYAKDYGFSHDFLALARKINSQMPNYTVKLLQDALSEFKAPINGAMVAVLGLSYKANVGDDRESPSYSIIDLLKKYGYNVITFDPYMPDKSSAASIDDAIKKADAIVLATNHEEFKSLNAERLNKNNIKAVIDGRNFLKDMKKEFLDKNIIYRGIGL